MSLSLCVLAAYSEEQAISREGGDESHIGKPGDDVKKLGKSCPREGYHMYGEQESVLLFPGLLFFFFSRERKKDSDLPTDRVGDTRVVSQTHNIKREPHLTDSWGLLYPSVLSFEAGRLERGNLVIIVLKPHLRVRAPERVGSGCTEDKSGPADLGGCGPARVAWFPDLQ